jgi:pantetheine-phosphate adenylyltransferase
MRLWLSIIAFLGMMGAAASAAPVILDDGDAGTSSQGQMYYASGVVRAYGDDNWWTNPVTSSANAYYGWQFSGLAVHFVRECGARVMLRGVRSLTDIEAEFTMTLANRALAHEIETVFLMASEKYTHISSSLIKQVAMFGIDTANGHEPLAAFVPREVIAPVRAKFQRVKREQGG